MLDSPRGWKEGGPVGLLLRQSPDLRWLGLLEGTRGQMTVRGMWSCRATQNPGRSRLEPCGVQTISSSAQSGLPESPGAVCLSPLGDSVEQKLLCTAQVSAGPAGSIQEQV